jgi:hypothetical protein
MTNRKRPPGVKAGDRVRVTIVHGGTITEIDDDGFVLETRPGRPMSGSFHGDGEFTWEPMPLPPEPPDGSVVRVSDTAMWRVFERDDRDARDFPNPERHWYPASAGDGARLSWADVCEAAEPGVPVPLAPDPLAGEPIQLPVECVDGDGDLIRVNEPDANGDVPIELIPASGGPVGLVCLPRLVAARFARAALAAANQAERSGP